MAIKVNHEVGWIFLWGEEPAGISTVPDESEFRAFQ